MTAKTTLVKREPPESLSIQRPLLFQNQDQITLQGSLRIPAPSQPSPVQVLLEVLFQGSPTRVLPDLGRPSSRNAGKEKTVQVGASIEDESACVPVQESQPGSSKDSAPWPHVEEPPPIDRPVVAMGTEIRNTECGQDFSQALPVVSSEGKKSKVPPGLTASKTHQLARSHQENTIVMTLYCDDIELANPIGMKRSLRGKLTVFYISFVNVPLSLRSQVSNIFLLAVGNSSDLKSLNTKAVVLQDFISTLKALETGCSLKTAHGQELFFGFLLAYIGDSLACHNIAGFKESFSKNVRFACRTCMLPTLDFHKFHHEIQCPLRTESQYRGHLLELQEATLKKVRIELSAKYGIKTRSVLADIPHFSLLSDLLYDPMHILLEGVVPLELSLFSKFIVKGAAWMSLSQLNKALSEFNFRRLVSKSDYPRFFEADFSFPSSASSSLVLLLHFLLIVKDFLPEGYTQESHCECFVLLCVITQLLVSPVMSPDTLGELDYLVARHNELFVSLYGPDAFRPKHHMLVHIITQIKGFGPSHHHWTMRFEGKNALPKSKKFFNFKNIPKSVAEFFQMKMSSDLWMGPGLPNLDYRHSNTVSEIGVPVCLTSAFVQCGLEPHDVGRTAMSVSSACVSNVKISLSDVVVFAENDESMFGQVDTIVHWRDMVFLTLHLLAKVRYSKEVNAFILMKTPHTSVIRPESLFYPWPLFTYTKDDLLYGISKCVCESPFP
ncbi:uncharacterized protein [Dermacentor albipictus]|uniref:uncharacterized protein n=1 Tax=Dermacentor albipictus TaxID=60249 RepID=UPI0038FCBDF3